MPFHRLQLIARILMKIARALSIITRILRSDRLDYDILTMKANSEKILQVLPIGTILPWVNRSIK